MFRSDADACVDAFEDAWRCEDAVDFLAFAPPPSHEHYGEILCELACVDMELRWDRPDRKRADDYRAACPGLAENQVWMAALVGQEQRLSQGDDVRGDVSHPRSEVAPWPRPPANSPPGEPGSHSRWLERTAVAYAEYRRQSAATQGTPVFPRSVSDAELLLGLGWPFAAQSLDGGGSPQVDADFGDFRLLRELGRGAFSRVFLAEQQGLARRQVVLKVSDLPIDESQMLAQLQHSNIVPIYSAHWIGGFRAVCMPFLGATTLAAVVQHCGPNAPPGDGNPVLQALSRRDATLAAPPERLGSAVRGLSPVRSIVWLAAQLADGLAHAHARGILHRDLKPANVLIEDSGVPLLLDFNMSEDVRLHGSLPALVGGTLQYMAPEQIDALRGGHQPVDARSDLYSLGLILHELLTGRPAFEAHSGLPLSERLERLLADRRAGLPVAAEDRTISAAVRAIVRTCLHPDSNRRYQSAWQLREDAQRHLDDLPLAHVHEPSILERTGKWVRRNRRLAGIGGVVVLTALLAFSVILYARQHAHASRIEAAAGQQLAMDELREAEMLLSQPFPDPEELAEGERLCRRALARFQLPSREDWERLPAFTLLDVQEQEQTRGGCGELLLLLVRPVAARAATLTDPSERRLQLDQALRLNDLADRCLSGRAPRRAVAWQRSRLMELRGDGEAARTLAATAEAIPALDRLDYFLLGGELAGQGKLQAALEWLDQAQRQAADRPAVWSAQAACYAALGRFDRAAAGFQTAVALRPDFWRGSLWLGQARLELQEYEAAVRDFETVIRLRPSLAAGHFFRALAHLGRGNLAAAEADLSRALELEPANTRLYFSRSRVRTMAGDAAGAKDDYQRGLERPPADELSWITRGEARVAADPQGALADFREALRLNPRSRTALQNSAHVLSEKLGKTSEALATLDQLVTQAPDFVAALAGRGVLRARVGQYDGARSDAKDALRLDARPATAYQVACIYALTSRDRPDDRVEALSLLWRAIRNGYGGELLGRDPDLDPLRADPEFQRLESAAKTLREQGR